MRTHIKAVCLVFVLLIASIFLKVSVVHASAVRGTSGDFWADVILGKRDFTEISARKVSNYRVNSPGGVIVDKNASTSGELYAWDSGNSRIVGIDLASCYAASGTCFTNIVFGQAYDTDRGACNRDASFQDYPNRPAASADTLCGIDVDTVTTLEDKTFSSMYVASDSALFVADLFNQRVLKYNSPLTTDTTADDVWGQSNYTDDSCNQGGSPSSTSLCLMNTSTRVGAGVTMDSSGNLWVADGGNNRVLRYPVSGGTISHTADLVLGQSGFTTNSSGTGVAQMHGPTSLRFDSNGKLYVSDALNGRILTFTAPFTSGMNGSTFGSGFSLTMSVEYDAGRNSIWVSDALTSVKEFDLSGTQLTSFTEAGPGGSLGFDTNNDLLVSSYIYSDLYRYALSGGSFVRNKAFFGTTTASPGYNATTSDRLEQGGLGSVVVAGSQLIATDNRILYWNNPGSVTNGQPADGYVGGTSFNDLPGYKIVKADSNNHIWASTLTTVYAYDTPVSSTSSAIKTLTSPLTLLGNVGTIAFSNVSGILPTSNSEFLWISDSANNRVLRVRNPLTSLPVVDIVLGQKDASSTSCNQGLTPAPNTDPNRPASSDAPLNQLCYPGSLSFDKNGNLFLSDHWLEIQGNWRLLMFLANQFPSAPSSVIYNLTADKEFPRVTSSNTHAHATFEVAFDSHNRMVAGGNPYAGSSRFVEYYNNPLSINPADHSDPAYASPSGQLNDYSVWATGMSFDSSDNLYVYESNRGQIRRYLSPFYHSAITGTVTDAGTSSPISGATITYPGGTTTTDGSGQYTLPGFYTGTIAVSASKSGYATKMANVSVTTGSDSTQDFALPGIVFSDDFESGDFSSWTTNNNLTVQGTTVNTGSYAAEGNATSSATNLRKTLASGYSDLYYRTYFDIKSQASGSGLGLLGFRSTSDAAIIKVYVDGTTNKLCVRNEITATNTCSNTVPSQNAWHTVELHTIINGTSSTHEVWLDDTAITSLNSTSANLGTTNIGRLVLGETNTGRTFDVIFDDVSAENAHVGLKLGSIAGKVTDSLTYAVIDGATVSYSGGSVSSNSDGTYTLVNVPVGTYAVSASKTGYTTQSPNVTVSSTSQVTRDYALVLTTGHITGTVTDPATSAPLSGVTVTYSGGSTTTNSSGVYTFIGVSPGTYGVTVSKSGYTTRGKIVFVTAGTTTTKDFGLPLQVFSDDFESGNFNAWTTNNNLTAQTTSTHFGSYAAEGNTTGSNAMNVKKTFASSYQDLYFRTYYVLKSHASGSNVSLMAFRTAADGALFKVYIDGTTDKLCMRNEVTAVSTCSTTVPTSNFWHVLEMHVYINGSSASAHEVWLDGTSISALTSTSANLGTTNIGRITLGETTTGRTYDVVFDDVMVQTSAIGNAGGTLTGVIKDAQTLDDLSGATVSITGNSRTTDGSGVFTFDDIAPATYTVTASKTNYTDNTDSAPVYAGEGVGVVIALTGSNIGTVSGTVTDAGTGSAINGATVSYSGGSATTNSSGQYTISGVAAGTYTFTASKTGFTTKTALVTVTSGNTTTQNFALPLVIFSDDFESGNFNAWTTNNNLTAQTTTVHAGTYAAEGNTTSTATNLRKTLSTGYSDVYDRVYFYIKSQASGSGLGLVSFRDTGDTALVKVYVDGTTNKLCLRNEKTNTNTCSNTVPTQNAWHSVELHAIINGTSSTHEVWYDGTQDSTFTSTSDDLGTTNIGRLVLGEVNSGRTFDVVFDDQVVQNAAVGP